MIAAIAVKKSSAIAAITAIIWKPYSRCDRWGPWTFFLSAITAIVAIIWNQALGRYHLLELSDRPEQSSRQKNFMINQNC